MKLQKQSNQIETIVLKSDLSKEEAEKLVERKKTNYFGHLLKKPEKSQIHVHSLTLSYEPHLILSGKYNANFFRKRIQPIKVDGNVKEIVLGRGVFHVASKPAFLKKLEGKYGKNKVELELEEHVFVEDERKLILDRHGIESSFSYKLSGTNQENYPQKILNENSVKDFELTDNAAVKRLIEKMKEKSIDYDVRDLKEDYIVNKTLKIYVPIYEARLVGPKKKVKIMRIDGVKKKVI